jgi:hypothetical protein
LRIGVLDLDALVIDDAVGLGGILGRDLVAVVRDTLIIHPLVDLVKTAEQVAAEDQKRLDTEQRANRDRNLLTTYGSVQEIEHLRDQRLSLLIDQIKLKEQFLETLNVKMNKLRVTSSHYKPYSSDPKAPPMTDQLTEDLVRVGSDIHTQEENLREKRTEQANTNQAFEGDIARFKELKGIH